MTLRASVTKLRRIQAKRISRRRPPPPMGLTEVWCAGRTKQGPPCGGPCDSKTSDRKTDQGMVNRSENGEVWPEPELVWGW